MLDELIPHYDDTLGEVTIRKPDDQSASQKINDPRDPESVMVSGDQQHDITLSVGPAKESERQESSEFADLIVQNAPLMQIIGPQKAAELNALAIRLKAVGPIGDEMADLISPKQPDEGAPPTPEQVRDLQGQLQQAQQQLQQATQAIETDQAKQAATIEAAKIKAANDLAIAHVNNAARIAIARISAAKSALDIAAESAEERLATGLELAHEAEQSELDRQHEAATAAAGHARALEAGDVAHQQGLEVAEQQAGTAAEQAEAQRAHEAEMAAQAAAQQQGVE